MFFRVYKNKVPFSIWDQKYENAFIFIAGGVKIDYLIIYNTREGAENAIKGYKKDKYIKGIDHENIYSCAKWYIDTVEKTLCRMINNKELKIVKQGIIGGTKYVL